MNSAYFSPIMRYFSFFSFLLLSSLVFAQSITLTYTSAPTSAAYGAAALKYDKNFAYSLTLDDTWRDAYTVALPYFKGGYVAGNNTSYTGLHYTDGCGNNLPFKAAIGWNSVNKSYLDIHNDNVQEFMTWAQADILYNNNWDIINHSYSHKFSFPPLGVNEYITEIEQNSSYFNSKLNSKINNNFFIVPAGDTGYYQAIKPVGIKAIFDQNYKFSGLNGLAVDQKYDYSNFRLFRQTLDDDPVTIDNYVKVIAANSSNNKHYWLNEFTHNIGNFNGLAPGGLRFSTFKSHMDFLYNTYGKNGLDNMWMAPLQEVYEYLVCRDSITYTVSSNGNIANLNFNLNNVSQDLRRKTLTLTVKSNVDFVVSSSQNIKSYTYKGIGNSKIINIEFLDVNTITTPPTIKITSPKNNDVFKRTLPMDIYVNTNASIGIKNVKHYLNNKLIGISGTAPFNYTYTPVAEGKFKLTSILEDNQGKFVADSIDIVVTPNTAILDLNTRKSIKIYPNPTNDILQVLIFDNSFLKTKIIARIYDMSGKLIYDTQYSKTNSFVLDIQSFTKGNYILQLQNDEKSIFEQFVKN
jgi:Secretion system C-terminal sorting domain/Bacterial Ig domain